MTATAASNWERFDALQDLTRLSSATDAIIAREYACEEKTHMLDELERYVEELERTTATKGDGDAPQLPFDLSQIAQSCALLRSGADHHASQYRDPAVTVMMNEYGERVAAQLERHCRRLEAVTTRLEL